VITVDEFDHVVICGAGDMTLLGEAFSDVRGVESVVTRPEQVQLVVRHRSGILCRLVELADLSDVDITLVVVLPQTR
jgi:hypothetical protein